MAEERGVDTCFLALGMATWIPTKGTSVPAAPVLLCHAEISASGAAETDFSLKLTGDMEVNPTLLQFLEEHFDISVDPDSLLDLLSDTSAQDTDPLFKQLEKEATAVPGFRVERRKVLGNFSFAKLPMVQDLRDNIDALLESDIIAVLAGDESARTGLGRAGRSVDTNEPDFIPPQDEYLVLDADSSQSWAINAALRDQNIVVKGPPGTGKSQTIANLIACLAARGKRVLFVAEKQAAINAVLDRLNRVGLAGLIFDLHGGSGSRRGVAQSLAVALHTAATVPARRYDQIHEDVVATRSRLSTFADAVNQPRGHWETSVFGAQAKALALKTQHGDVVQTRVRLPRAVLDRLDAHGARRVTSDLHDFADLGGFTLAAHSTPWFGANVMNEEQARAAYETILELCNDIHPAADAALSGALADTRLRAPERLDEWGAFAKLLSDVDQTLAVLRREAFTAPIEQYAAATATTAWRKRNPGWVRLRAGCIVWVICVICAPVTVAYGFRVPVRWPAWVCGF